MASHEPENYRFSTIAYFILFGTLLTAYYVFVHHPCLQTSILTNATQLGLLHGAKESFQDADSRHPQIPQNIPPAPLEYGTEPYIHPNKTWVRHTRLLKMFIADRLKESSTDKRLVGILAQTQLRCRLDHELYMGCLHWYRLHYPIFLLRVFYHRLDSSLLSGL
jgi:hypothetical protein